VAGERPGRDHHPARRLAQDRLHVRRESPAEAAARLHRRADHEQLGSVVVGDLRQVTAESPLARTDDAPPHADAVRVGDRGRAVEPGAELGDLVVELRVERQLLLDDERRDEDDVGSAVGGEPARKIERVLRLRPAEERDDDAAIADRRGAAGEAARPLAHPAKVGPLHRMTW
jgi:hypothetical protein